MNSRPVSAKDPDLLETLLSVESAIRSLTFAEKEVEFDEDDELSDEHEATCAAAAWYVSGAKRRLEIAKASLDALVSDRERGAA